MLTGLPGKLSTGTSFTTAVPCGPPGCIATWPKCAPRGVRGFLHYLEVAHGHSAGGEHQISDRGCVREQFAELGGVFAASGDGYDIGAVGFGQCCQSWTVGIVDLTGFESCSGTFQFGARP